MDYQNKVLPIIPCRESCSTLSTPTFRCMYLGCLMLISSFTQYAIIPEIKFKFKSRTALIVTHFNSCFLFYGDCVTDDVWCLWNMYYICKPPVCVHKYRLNSLTWTLLTLLYEATSCSNRWSDSELGLSHMNTHTINHAGLRLFLSAHTWCLSSVWRLLTGEATQ